MRNPANVVLLIEDEPQIRRFISAGLDLQGYIVREADTGAAGLSAVIHARPDLIVLDLGLPDMGGADVLKTIRSVECPDHRAFDRSRRRAEGASA
jgi:two-component system KDP operon response regulator KdpE